jgi:hypothetical protein
MSQFEIMEKIQITLSIDTLSISRHSVMNFAGGQIGCLKYTNISRILGYLVAYRDCRDIIWCR